MIGSAAGEERWVIGAQLEFDNVLLRFLQPADYELLAPHLKLSPLDAGDLLASAGEPFETVCFPEASVISIAEVLGDGGCVEIGIIGICGMVGYPVLLGSDVSPHEVKVQVGGGRAFQMTVEALRAACRRSPTLTESLLRFVHALTVQSSRTSASNLRDSTEKRLSRWLLMCHDRMPGDEIALTHRFIGMTLGVRRATVTDTLHLLEGTGVLQSSRGLIIVRDRAGLEEIAGSSYGFPERIYRELIGPFGKSAQPL